MKIRSDNKSLPTRITFLELHQRQDVNVQLSPRQIALFRAKNIPVHFYRYLYQLVGKPHHWSYRRAMDDRDLGELLHDDRTLIEVLYVDGCPAGFCELSLFDWPQFIEISYFGLVPDYQGMGLGRYFLNECLCVAWDRKPGFIKIQTNTLDNPRALQLYQQFGFTPVGFAEAFVEAWQ